MWKCFLNKSKVAGLTFRFNIPPIKHINCIRTKIIEINNVDFKKYNDDDIKYLQQSHLKLGWSTYPFNCSISKAFQATKCFIW